MNIITAADLSFEYKSYDENDKVIGSISVLSGVNLEIPEGQFVAVLGHNGSGKSTLAKHFKGILTPTKGVVTVDGLDVSDESALLKLRQTVGMVFQNPDNQIVATVVEEDVAFAPENLGVPPEIIRERVDQALKTVDMSRFAKHAPHQLSGGQKQRVAIAGVIAMQPKIIVLDEPTAMLDPKGRAEVIGTVKRLNKNGATIVYITHYMEEAAEADRVVVMDSGRVIMDGTPREVFGRVDEMKAAGLDVPQATQLAYELRRRGYDIRGDIIYEDECADEIMRLFEGAGNG